MKRIVPLILMMTLLSCNGLFHEEELSISDITSTAELEEAVNGLYGQFTSLFTEEARLRTGVGFFVANVKGDDLGSNLYPIYYHYYGKNTDCENPATDKNISGPWQDIYAIISSANNIIKQYEPEETTDPRERNLLGEAYFFRAYFYFWLTRTYGRIPLVSDIEINYSTSLADFEEIYRFIENDFMTAMRLLPGKNENARIPFVTVHRGTAKALLAEVYLSWAGYPVKDDSKYALAAQVAGEVIDSADYFGFGLEEDFADVWKEENRYNAETMLALYFSTPDSTTSMNIVFDVGSEINTCYTGYNDFGWSTFGIEADTSDIFIRFFATEINFFNSYPKNYRKDITFFTSIYVPGWDVRDHPELDSMQVDVLTANECARPAYRKFYYTSSVNIQDSVFCMTTPLKKRFHGNTKIYLYRYANLLLTYAEAMARSGQLTGDTYEAVNQIRRRAWHVDIHSPSVYDLPSGLSPEAFADSVVQESAWELAGEPEGRWFDLVRLERVEELEYTRHEQEGGFPQGTVTKEDYFLTIPEDDQILNPNLADQ